MTTSNQISILSKGVKEGRIPQFLYIYMKVSSAKRFLEQAALWMSSYDKFNDPFEFSYSLSCDYSEEELLQWLGNTDKGIKNDILYLEKEDVNFNKIINKIVSKAIHKELKEMGLRCFTEKSDNLLMWAHYAEEHKGVCLKFDILEAAEFFKNLVRVRYNDKYPELNYIRESKEKVVEILRHKSKAWEYEREWRVIKLGEGNKLAPISPTSLVEIIFGCRCTEENQKEIQEKCKNGAFESVRFSSKSSGVYELSFEEIK